VEPISSSFPHFVVSRAGIAATVTAVAAVSCGGGSLTNPDGPVADGATSDTVAGDGGDAAACIQHVPPGATFIFHVRNDATEPRYMYFGCGHNPPIAVEAAQGLQGIGPESAYFCGYTCDPVFAGQSVPSGCTDCGPGVSMTLAPGATVDVPWDRRLWTEVVIPPPCSGLSQPAICALGTAVDATMVHGTVAYCGVQPPTLSCPTANSLTTSFVADLSLDELEISIQ
jgi:hypothetical protein